MTTPTLSGFYRYTDIWFKWHESISSVNSEDGARVKCVLAHDSLVHPDHPLHPGESGIQLYMGFFPNGQARLLFSSAQVDYLRYWLHAMGITKERVPLPYSNCLLLASELKTISPIIYTTGGDLRNGLKAIEKNNKRLKNSSSLLTSRRDVFERVRNLWSQKNGAWIALDFEAWEYEHGLVTELGISSIHWEDGNEVLEDEHYMISATEFLNGRFVDNNRTNYDFGESKVIGKKEFAKIIAQTLERLSKYGATILVFHDASGDVKTMQDIGAPIKNLNFLLPDSLPQDGVFVVDTNDVFGALVGDESANKHKLERVCHLLQISPVKHLHNAGNDAHFTMAALKAMASHGAPLDVQREERWPQHTGPRGGVSVEFTPEEEEIDDDMDLYYD